VTLKNHEAGEVCGMCGGEEGCIQEFGREGDHSEDLSLDRKMILKWLLNKLVRNSCKGEVDGVGESGNELLCSINCGEFD
jgi:hypothetical protein